VRRKYAEWGGHQPAQGFRPALRLGGVEPATPLAYVKRSLTRRRKAFSSPFSSAANRAVKERAVIS
jgi:hypothetical protein